MTAAEPTVPKAEIWSAQSFVFRGTDAWKTFMVGSGVCQGGINHVGHTLGLVPCAF